MYIPCTTCLHMLLAHSCLYYYLLSVQYTVLHIILFFILFYFLFLLFISHTYIYVYAFVFVFHIIALSMEWTWPTFHCLLYSVLLWRTNKNLKSWMTPRPPSNMEVKTLCFGGVFLQRGEDNCTTSKGLWAGSCTARALKMGHGWAWQWPKTHGQGNKGGSRRSTFYNLEWPSQFLDPKSVEGAEGSSCQTSASKP